MELSLVIIVFYTVTSLLKTSQHAATGQSHTSPPLIGLGATKHDGVIVPLIELKGLSCLSRCAGFLRSPVPLSTTDFPASRRPDGRLQSPTLRHVVTFRLLTKHYVSILAACLLAGGRAEASLSLSGMHQFDCHCHAEDQACPFSGLWSNCCPWTDFKQPAACFLKHVPCGPW